MCLFNPVASEGNTHFLHLQPEILEKVGPDALKLGLLMGTEGEEHQEALSFHHLLFMQFVAGKYISTLSQVCCGLHFRPAASRSFVRKRVQIPHWKRMNHCRNTAQATQTDQLLSQFPDFCFQSELQQICPDWETVETHTEVLRFAAGLSDDVAQFLQELFQTKDQTLAARRTLRDVLSDSYLSSEDVLSHVSSSDSTDRKSGEVNISKVCQNSCPSSQMKII